MKLFRHIPALLILIVASCVLPLSAASQATLKVSLDSAFLLMGKTTPLHIELVESENATGHLVIPKDSICDKVEILEILNADTSSIGSGRREIHQELILQSFDSGTYRLNPIRYIAGADTILSNRPVLKVVPVAIDSMATIHDYADIADVDRKFIDYLPDFIVDYGLWILAVIIAGVIAYFVIARFLKKKEEAPVVKEKPVPPYEKAVMALNNLHADKLCEQGKEKEFYTRLTDILRVYLQERFGINAMEMTSTEIRRSLQSNELTRLSKRNMDAVLEMADFVKFAKMRPLPEDNNRAFSSAMKFVEDTKPAPEPEKSDDEKETSARPSTPDKN